MSNQYSSGDDASPCSYPPSSPQPSSPSPNLERPSPVSRIQDLLKYANPLSYGVKPSTERHKSLLAANRTASTPYPAQNLGESSTEGGKAPRMKFQHKVRSRTTAVGRRHPLANGEDQTDMDLAPDNTIPFEEPPPTTTEPPYEEFQSPESQPAGANLDKTISDIPQTSMQFDESQANNVGNVAFTAPQNQQSGQLIPPPIEDQHIGDEGERSPEEYQHGTSEQPPRKRQKGPNREPLSPPRVQSLPSPPTTNLPRPSSEQQGLSSTPSTAGNIENATNHHHHSSRGSTSTATPSPTKSLPPTNPNPAIEGFIARRVEELFSISAEAAIANAIRNQLPPMLSSVAESCTKNFYAQIASSFDGKRTKRSSQPSCTSRHAPSGSASRSIPLEEDYDMNTDDADDEDDIDESPRRRSGGRKSPTTNALHSIFRQYLRNKKLLYLPGEAGPVSPSPEQICAYEEDGDGGPMLPNILIDWDSPPKASGWNSDAIALLATDFHALLQKEEVLEYDEALMNIDALRNLCAEKLVRTRKFVLQQAALQCMTTDEQKLTRNGLAKVTARKRQLDRINARRRSLYNRRERIVRENFDRDPATWRTVQSMLSALGPGGMSGDETDTQLRRSRNQAKTVHRLISHWLHPSISEFFSVLDTYTGVVAQECLINTRGNKPLDRLGSAIETKNNPPISKLPKNWYNPEWYKTLSVAAKAKLQVRRDIPLPILATYEDLPSAEL